MKSTGIILKITFVGLIILTIGTGGIRWSIRKGIEEAGTTAQATYPHPGDNVAALIDYVQSDKHTLHDRNLAVWALGQCRDKRALPVLKTLYKGRECEHSTVLCQYEIGKAVELLRK